MKKILVVILFGLLINISFAQTKKQLIRDFKKIESLEQAEAYCKEHPDWLAHIYTISENDSIRYQKALNMEIGKVFPYYDNKRKMNFVGKVMSNYHALVYDVQYIYLDGNKLSVIEIDSIQKSIISQVNNGITFDTLFSNFNMDNHPTGLLTEVRPGMLVDDFEKECKKHSEGDVFEVDLNKNGWFFVALLKKGVYKLEFIKLLSANYGTKK